MKTAKTRVKMLDILRGAAVIGMVLHHALVSYEIVFQQSVPILYTAVFTAVQLLFVAVFLIISGICTHYSKNVLKRGVIVFLAGMLLTVATCYVLPAFEIYGLNIYFGILHMFGLSMILYALTQKVLKKIPAPVGIIVFTLCFIAYYAFYLSGPTSDSWLLLPFGFLPNSMEYYGDYYPLLPFFFLFLVGTYIGKYVKANKFPNWFYNSSCPPLEFCGRYSLYVYILHQPIIFPIMILLYSLKSL